MTKTEKYISIFVILLIISLFFFVRGLSYTPREYKLSDFQFTSGLIEEVSYSDENLSYQIKKQGDDRILLVSLDGQDTQHLDEVWCVGKNISLYYEKYNDNGDYYYFIRELVIDGEKYMDLNESIESLNARSIEAGKVKHRYTFAIISLVLALVYLMFYFLAKKFDWK